MSPVVDQPIILDLDKQRFVSTLEPCSVNWWGIDELELQRRTNKALVKGFDWRFKARLILRYRVLGPDLIPEQPEVSLSESLDRLELDSDRYLDDGRPIELGEVSRSVSHGVPIVR